MLRLFIKKKLKSAKVTQEGSRELKNNRRAAPRYPVDHKHLTVMNDQDIFVIRDISAKGFSTYVSERGWERLNVGDHYDARIRYLGDLYDLEARVSWKAHLEIVGFEIMNADKKTFDFMERLIYPIKLANSLHEVRASFMVENYEGKSWYHGDDETDLFLWHAADGHLTAWQLVTRLNYISWGEQRGLETGTLKYESLSLSGVLEMNPNEKRHVADAQTNEKTLQLAVDVIMATQIENRESVLKTLMEE